MGILKDLLKTVQGAKAELDQEDDSTKLVVYVVAAVAALFVLALVIGLVALLADLAWKLIPVAVVGGVVYAVAVSKGWVKRPKFLTLKK